jgi:hypothetical protein
MNIYTDNGYENRKDYLLMLADDYDIDIETVSAIAGLLGRSEDFDGLLTALEDCANYQ